VYWAGGSVARFVLAGLCEIGGGYLVWQWWRNGAHVIIGLLRAATLILYLDDQALAGGIMWSGGHMYLAAVLVLLHRALGSERPEPGLAEGPGRWSVGGGAGAAPPDETSTETLAPEGQTATAQPGPERRVT
jgi:drug/metabolite transporter superfamily protein YnfA